MSTDRIERLRPWLCTVSVMITLAIALAGCAPSGKTVLGRGRPAHAELSYCYWGRASDYGPKLHLFVLRFETEEAAVSWSDKFLEPIPAPQHHTFHVPSKEGCSWPGDVSEADMIGSHLGQLDKLYGFRDGATVWLEGWED